VSHAWRELASTHARLDARDAQCLGQARRLEIDNLITERALRGVAIGRRNWLFAGSMADGERAAAIYSIIETCKLDGVEPFAYISGVMQKIAEGWPNSRIGLMPWAWSLMAQQKAA
jgi:transposase